MPEPEWWNWQTRTTQNRVGLSRAGSTPASGTKKEMKLTLPKVRLKDLALLISVIILLLLIGVLRYFVVTRPPLKFASLKKAAKKAKTASSFNKTPFILLGLATLEDETTVSTFKTATSDGNLPLPPPNAAKIPLSAAATIYAKSEDGLNVAFSATEPATLYYAGQNYFLVIGGQTKAVTKKPITFTAGDNQPLYLPDYTDLNWDKTVNLNAFAGAITVVYSPKSRRLWAINELPLETYLQGITEAAPDSPPEHLKTMAIVARSYAYFHVKNGGRHLGEPFHLKNSRNGNGDDQVYQGYLAAVRLPQIAGAARQTKGQVVTYKGQPVITPYSAVAGGRTLSPQEAGWNYNWPWVKSVPDPDTAGMPRSGHGVGLSALGAKKKAARGETAAQILKYYFPGTTIGVVNTDNLNVKVAIYGVEVKE